jgi:hypothetical protein
VGTLGKPFTHKHNDLHVELLHHTSQHLQKEQIFNFKEICCSLPIICKVNSLPYPSRRTLKFLFVKHKSLAEMHFSHGLCTNQEWHTGGLSLLGESVNPVEISG